MPVAAAAVGVAAAGAAAAVRAPAAVAGRVAVVECLLARVVGAGGATTLAAPTSREVERAAAAGNSPA